MNKTTWIVRVKRLGWVLAVLLVVVLSAAVPAARAASPMAYVVSPGETLTALSERYAVPLGDLISLNRLGHNAYIYAGQSLRIPPAAADEVSIASTVRLFGVPLLRQRQSLTCEESAAAMASLGRFTESQLVRVMPRSANPFEGIRGRTNAPIWGSLSDYGVYAQALRIGLGRLGFSSTMLYGQSYAVFKSAIAATLRAGQPVVWWTTYHEKRETPVRISLPDGSSVRLVRFEHTVTIVGMNSRGFIYHDPFNATVRVVSFADHQRASSYFNNMALVVDN